MPCLNLSTNVSLEGVDTSSILSEVTSVVASVIGKPEAYVMVVLKGSVPIAFGGTEHAAAYGELVSVGGLTPNVNKKLSAAISAIFEKKLSVPESRFFIKFYESKAHQSQEHLQGLHAVHQQQIMVQTSDGMAPLSEFGSLKLCVVRCGICLSVR